MALDLGTLAAKFRVDSSGLSGDLAEAEGKSTSFASGLGGKIGGIFAALGIAKLGTDMVSLGLKTAGAMENASIAFTTMLGSGEKAQDFLSRLKAFAAATPFEFPELQTAASSLISVGIDADKVIPIMKTLGNVTSGMGTGSEGIKRATVALQQMTAAGKIQAEDLNQLRDAGIPVYDLLAAALGKTKEEVAGLAQNGKLGKDALDKMMGALESGKGLEKFNGLMEKQSLSLQGLWSTFQDNLGMGLATALEPVLPLLKDGLGAASTAVQEALSGVAKGLAWVVDAGKGLAALLGDGNFTEGFAKAFSVSEDSPIVGFLLNVRDGFSLLGTDASAAFAAVDNGATGLSGPMGKAVELFHQLQVNGADAWFLIQEAASAAEPVLMPLLQGLGDVIWNQIIPAFLDLYTFILQVYDELAPIFAEFFSGMMERIQPMVPAITEIFGVIGEIIGTAVEIIKGIIGPGVQWISDMWAQHGERIMNVVSALFGGLIETIRGDLGFISNIMKAVMDLIHGDWGAAWGHIKDATADLMRAIKGGVDAGMNAMHAAIGDKLDAIAEWFRNLPGRITSALGNLGGLLKNAGLNILQGLLDGLLEKWRGVTDFVGGIAGWIQAHKGPLPYDYLLLQPAGRAIMAGLGDSLVGEIPNLESDLNRVTRTVQGFGANLYGTAGAGGSGAAGGFPDTITLVDADGSILAKTRVVAVSAVESVWSGSTSLTRKEGAAA